MTKQGLYVEGLLENTLSKPEELLPIVSAGNKRRAVCFTQKNAQSSRSHAVLVVTVDVDLPPNYSTGLGARRTIARMNLVDLAGAEKIEKVQLRMRPCGRRCTCMPDSG